MKAITIRQPWASLIVHDIKDIENRTWVCPKKYIGQRVLIHASMAIDRSKSPLLTEQQFEIIGGKEEYQKHYFSNTGSIIGSVQIVDCVQNHPSVWAEKGVYNWALANPVLFEKPIPAKGKLSFWESGLSEEELTEHFKTKEQ